MKSFFQRKSAAPYYNGRSYTIAIRKDYVELYHNLGDKWHSIINVEVYKDAVRMIVRLGATFTQDLFDKVMIKGLDVEKYPLLTELISPDSPYKIVVDRTGKDAETRMVRDIEGEHKNFLLALGDPKILEAAEDIRDYLSTSTTNSSSRPTLTSYPSPITSTTDSIILLSPKKATFWCPMRVRSTAAGSPSLWKGVGGGEASQSGAPRPTRHFWTLTQIGPVVD